MESEESRAEATQDETRGLIGKQVPWKLAERHVFRVIRYSGLAVVQGSQVKAIGLMPYGLATVESPLLDGPYMLPVAHRVNFLQLRFIYEVGRWDQWMAQNAHELLAAYVPAKGLRTLTFPPPLQLRIAPARTLEAHYARGTPESIPSRLEELFGKINYLYPPEEIVALLGEGSATPRSIPRLG